MKSLTSALFALLFAVTLFGGEDAETARRSEFESIQKEMEALQPGANPGKEEILTFIEAAKEKFGGFALKYKKTPEGFEAGTMVASLLSQVKHPDAAKYAEIAAEAAPAAGVDVKRVAMCWLLVSQGKFMDRDPDGARAALEKVKPLDNEMYEKISPQFEEIEKKARHSLAMSKKLVAGAEPLPIETKDIDGKDFKLSALKGKVVIIDFWATWCGPCIAEMPNLLKIYKDLKEKGLEIVGISSDNNEPQLRGGIEQLGITWPIICDYKGPDNVLGQEWGIWGIPHIVVLDRKGVIRHVGVKGPPLREAVEKLLAE